MKILSLSLLLLLAATVCASRPSVPKLIELVTSNNAESEAELLEKERLSINYPNCRSWHYGVETSSIIFDTVPENCQDYVEDYLTTSKQYQYDSKTVCKEAYFFAKGLDLKNDTVNAWIFDLDETLLSNAPFYSHYGYGTKKPDEKTLTKWVKSGLAPALPETLHLYQNLQELGIEPVLLTERYEDLKEATLQNLADVGFTYWKDVIFKPTGSRTKIYNFKSKERSKLKKNGYTIIGNIGDQWVDLIKNTPGKRTFKLPNPLYYKP